MRWSRQSPIPFITEQEREAKAQEREQRKEPRTVQMLATLQGSPMANPMSWKDKAWGKCLICRQEGQWAKKYPNHDKSAETSCYKCHQLGHWASLCPWDQTASRLSAKPSLRMIQQDWSSLYQSTSLSQIIIMRLEPRVKLDVAGRSENFLIDMVATYFVLTSYSRAFSSQTCTILSATSKTIIKDSIRHFFVAGMDKYFPTTFWWSLSVLLSYWKRSFPGFENLQLLQSWQKML